MTSQLKKKVLVIVFSVAVFAVQGAGAQDDVVELSTTVTGNQEQPKVLYIVPWKAADDNTILYQPLASRMSELFDHVERSEHRRQLQYLKTLESDLEKISK